MGLLQKACETFDHYYSVQDKLASKTPLVPISHLVTRAQLELTLDRDGNLLSATKVEKDQPKIIIPVTEDSGGRTSAPCPHPLCDTLAYLAPYSGKKYSLYVQELTKWAQSPHSHPKLRPILTYVKAGTIVSDLSSRKLIKLDKKGNPDEEKLLVCWRVVMGDDTRDACWEDRTLFQAFIDYYHSQQQNSNQALCMIEGKLSTPAKQHPKGIIPINGNAKLISANDKSGFTYLGRFTEDWQAQTVSYEASQKAHNALRWVAAEQGGQVVFGGRTFLCWNPHGTKIPSPTGSFRQRYATQKPAVTWTLYQKELQHTLNGWKSELPEQNADVVIAAFDAATTGRLSVTYYKELMASDFLQRLHDWDEHCCWWLWSKEHRCYIAQSPSLYQIVNCAFGTQRTEKNEVKLVTDDRILKQHMQRLMSCRVDCAKIPLDIEKALFHRASNPQAYDSGVYRQILFTACAVIRKYGFDYSKSQLIATDCKGEDLSMSLDKNKKDRSYQFGRLLAVMEKVERDTYDSNEEREPNAIRLQSVFCQRPFYSASLIEKQLNKAYFPRLTPASRSYYKRLMGDILDIIHDSPENEWNLPLTENYLMGYFLQRKELYTAKDNTSDSTTTDNN